VISATLVLFVQFKLEKISYIESYPFTTQYPSTWKKRDLSARGGSGLQFKHPKLNAFFTIEGGDSSWIGNTDKVMADRVKERKKKGFEITYKAQKDNWVVLSGISKKAQFYERYWIREKTYRSISFDYPASVGTEFDKMIGTISKSFDIGPDSAE
jgi:hypothetical protein